MLILLNKPYRVLCQFTDPDGRPTLADFVDVPGVYAAGRLDFDSEGLLLLTDDGRLQARISQPRSKIPKQYLVQVEGAASEEQLRNLVAGVQLKDGPARAVSAKSVPEPADLWPRDPPIRVRKSIADSWIEITLAEGRNRQVRRMTAAVGLPTLRLVRKSIGPFAVEGLKPGESRSIGNTEAWRLLQSA